DREQAANAGFTVVTHQRAGERNAIGDLRHISAVFGSQPLPQLQRVGFVQENECVDHRGLSTVPTELYASVSNSSSKNINRPGGSAASGSSPADSPDAVSG